MPKLLVRRLVSAGIISVCLFAPASVMASTFIPGGAISEFHIVRLPNGFAVGLSKGQRPVMHLVNMAHLARRAPTFGAGMGNIPFRTRFTPQAYAKFKAAAAHNLAAPRGFINYSTSSAWGEAPLPEQFATGMTDNGIICPYFGNGCQPPDMAVAASPKWIVQATNTAVAVFDKNGVMVLGYPVDFATFFGVPPSCHGYPFTSDPRAFYDPNDKRFFIAMAASNGVADKCPFSSTQYIAVSQTSDPTFGWNIYAVNSALGAPKDYSDFTQFGFDSKAVYLGSNQFPCCAAGFDGAWTLILDKHGMENGASIPEPTVMGPYFAASSPTCPGGGCLLDTVNPTTSVANLSQQPQATILVSADQSNPIFPCGIAGVTCKDIDVFAISKPFSPSPLVSEKTVRLLNSFSLAPFGDQPACPGCMETSDNRISGTPTYSPYGGGRVSFALETGVAFGYVVYPGYQWGEIAISESGGKITGATLTQSGIVAQSNATNSFAVTQLTPSGDLFVASDLMSAAIYPGWEYRLHRAGWPAGVLGAPRGVHGGLDDFLPFVGIPGAGNLRWGDFEAASYDGFSTNNVWLASQYGNTNYDWGTSLAKVH